MTQFETDHDTWGLEAEVRIAFEQGSDVQKRVQQLALLRFSAYFHNIESLKLIVAAVLHGARDGAQQRLNQPSAQPDLVRERIGEAVTGLELALVKFALASKLAVEESVRLKQEVSSEDLSRMRTNLEGLNEMFLRTLQASASGSNDALGEALRDLVTHFRTNGSAIGIQANETLDILVRWLGTKGGAQAGTGLHLARATSHFLHEMAFYPALGLSVHISQSDQNREEH